MPCPELGEEEFLNERDVHNSYYQLALEYNLCKLGMDKLIQFHRER